MNRNVFFLLIICVWVACSKTESVYVVCDAENRIIHTAGKELVRCLSLIYPERTFEIAEKKVEGSKNIVLEITDNVGSETESEEAFKVSGDDVQLTILGRTPRALLNGVYGLLEKLGYGFYLSFEAAPPVKKELDFTTLNFSDSPLAEERIVFNWHNFLSGCSAWDFQEWKDWIDHSSGMRFNTIMVHAYGNNPMFTWSFNGKQKRTSPLPASKGGRDYGTHQVNDVRRLHGGDVFDHSVFGSEISRLEPEQQPETVQKLMGQVFDHAKAHGMKICFALDIDTYPANPQELVSTLPSSSRFCISLKPHPYGGRYQGTVCMANPETPDGYAFYRSQLFSLLQLYPQIDQVVLWMRHERSEWLLLKLDQLPLNWQTEYKEMIRLHPELSTWEDAPGRFALGKVITAFQKALKEIGREDVVLKTGSWTFNWMEPAHVFFPQDVGFIGLDYNILKGTSDIDLPEQQKRITEISQSRQVIPVFWAHHDDGAYMGRPFIPIINVQDKLDRIGAGGFGIIHWTTWPLDPYFKNMAMQVWKGTLNESYQVTANRMAGSLFGPEQGKRTTAYLNEWTASAPVMGRETREWFIDHAFSDQKVEEVAGGCGQRLNLLEAVSVRALTGYGKKYLQYFKGLEVFSREFYRIEHAYQQSLRHYAEGAVNEAEEAIRQCNPEQIVDQYARFSAGKGITKGEKGILISLNLSWIPYIESQRQALRESPIRCNFAPTIHPKFGQGLLLTNFFIDKEQNLWRNYGFEETGAPAYELSDKLRLGRTGSIPGVFEEIYFSGIESDSTIRFTIRPMMSDVKPVGPTRDLISNRVRPGPYQLQLLFASSLKGNTDENITDILVYTHPGQPAVATDIINVRRNTGGKTGMILKTYDLIVPDKGEVIIELKAMKGKAGICGAVLIPRKSDTGS